MTAFETENLFAQATDPGQYDGPAIDWQQEGGAGNIVREWLKRTVVADMAMYAAGQHCVDLGAGTGWLASALLEKYDAASATAVEPASYATQIPEHHPGVAVENIPAQDWEPAQSHFGLVTAVMSTEHIADLGGLFGRIHNALRPSGKLAVVHGDVEYFKTPRDDFTIAHQEYDDSHPENVDGHPFTVVSVDRHSDFGRTVDLLRPVSSMQAIARSAGFMAIKHVPLRPDAELVAARPRYANQPRPIMHYTVFEKLSA